MSAFSQVQRAAFATQPAVLIYFIGLAIAIYQTAGVNLRAF